MRLRLLASSLVAVIAAALLSAPAQAAPAPAKVGLVSFTAGSTHQVGGRTYARVTLSWPKAKRAKKYQVFVSRTAAGVARKKKPTATVKGTKATIGKLGRNREYWFQVRAVNGKKAGARSSRVARVTMVASPALNTRTSPVYSLMSYNVCSNACSRWSTRRALATNEVLRLKPDVLAVQEASQWKKAVIPGYTETLGGHDNRIFYRTDRFEQVTHDLTPEQQSAECPIAEDPETGRDLVDENGDPVRVEPCTLPVDGVAQPSGKNAPWALLRHKASGQRVVFVAVHLRVDDKKSMATYRAGQAGDILSGLRDQLAWWGLDANRVPVVLIGDFNTNRSRAGNWRLDEAMHANGFYDAYEQARAVSRQHFNTANPSWSTKPVVGVTWGDHVDKVWIRPGRSRVVSWANAGKMAGGRFVAPLPSDHHPLRVKVQVS